MAAVFVTKCQLGTALCDTIDFSDRRDLHSTLDPHNPLTHLKNKKRYIFEHFSQFSSYNILRRPQNFAKSSP